MAGLFERTSEHMRSGSSAVLSSDDKLRLYALFKQATVGECSTPKPSFFDMVGRSKWTSWSALGAMPQEQARAEYCELVALLDPGWEKAGPEGQAASKPAPERRQGGGMGPVFSTMQPEQADLEDSAKCLYDWAKEGNTAMVLQCLDGGAEPDQTDPESGLSAMHYASDAGHAAVVALLCDRGADINLQDGDGQTPLHCAALCGREVVIRLLLERGADQTVADSDGELAVDGAEGWLKNLFGQGAA